MDDLLDRINALTDDQLRMVAERDDASGVLASYRLAELRGVPAPERTAVVIGEGYAIVAQDGKITRIPIEGEVTKIIREEGGEYCVYSEDGSRSFGCYPSMADAEERLRQIHSFENAREGSFVSWDSSGGVARGQIEHIMREGVLGIPDSEFRIIAEPDDPAVLIRVWRETSEGWQPTETLVGHKMSTLRDIEPLSKATKREDDEDFLPVLKESFTPPEGVQQAAQRALDWIAEGHAGSGFTDVGRARAAQLARGDNVSEDTIRRMASYFARHEVDSQATGWNNGEEGFPTPGRVAWDAWGGDPGRTWAESVVERLEPKQACPIATQNVMVNLARRQTAIDIADYGPLNPGEPNDEYWAHLAEYFETTPDEARKSTCGNCAAFDMTEKMQTCIADGIAAGGGDEEDPWDVIDAGDLGYCRVFKFKCAAARSCSAWIAGGPITDETVKGLAKAQFVRKATEQRFTLGPLYVPEFMDAHGEWTDADELQTAVWEWVRSGDRRIFLQHDRDVEAGEWVEVMTMPQPWTVTMLGPDGSPIGEVTYPVNTVFLGVVWNEDAWPLVKRGELRGYSIGGFSDRVFAELPDDGVRDGLEMPRSEPED